MPFFLHSFANATSKAPAPQVGSQTAPHPLSPIFCWNSSAGVVTADMNSHRWYVVIGDTLASPSVSYDKRGLLPVDKGNVWYTPLLRIPVWQYRIFMAQMELVTQPIKEECAADEPKTEPQKALEATKKSKQPKDTEKPETAKIPPKEPEQEPMFSEGKGGQLSFF